MRIAYLTETRQIGGAERALADLAEGMAAAGHDVTVIAPQPDMVDFVSREAPSARPLRALRDDFHDAGSAVARVAELGRQLRAMTGLLRRLRPDVLHVNNGGWPGSDLLRLAPLAGRLAGVPARVMTVHSNPWARSGREQAVADALVWRTTEAIVCPSRAVATGLTERRAMPAGLARLIHYGVREPRDGADAAVARAELTGDGELLVGMVSARPVPEKGYAVFLEALRRAGFAGRAALVGRYPDGFERDVELAGLADRLALPGLRRDVGALYHAFDVLVVPSTAEECMPLVILEAAAAGTATYGSRLSGIPEAVEDGVSGRVFEPGDPAALAALLDAAGADDLAAMGRAARARWESLFTPERMLTEHDRLYAGLTATHE